MLLKIANCNSLKIEMTSACDVSNLLPMVEEQKYPDFAKRLNELMTIKGISCHSTPKVLWALHMKWLVDTQSA